MDLQQNFFSFFYNDFKVFIRKAINEGYREGNYLSHKDKV